MQAPTAPARYRPEGRVLVTGAAGFIASHVAIELVKRHGYEVIAYDVLDYPASISNLDEIADAPGFAFVNGNITDSVLVRHTLEKYNVDTIMHFAAQSHVDNSFGDSQVFTQTNVAGTHTLLEAARRFGRIRRFIHVSTDEVYGETDWGTPDSVLEPTNPYAASKAAAEMLVQSYRRSYGLPTIVTRGNNVYGPHQYPEKLIPKFILMLKAGTPVTIHGGGNSLRSFLYVKDVALAFDKILHVGADGAVYNISTPEEKSVIEVTRDLCARFGKTFDEAASWTEDRPFNDNRYYTDGSMLSELGWAPTTSWEDGLRQTVEWYTDGKNVARWDKARLSKEISGRHSNGVVAPPRAGDPFWPMPVQDCKLTYLKYYPDNRGIFSELTNTTKDSAKNGNKPVNQISMSVSRPHVIRGIHCSRYGKMVTCVAGSLVDYVVDLREESPTYLKWTCAELSSSNLKQIYIPPRCGHAFLAGAAGCTMVYGQEGAYNPPDEMNIRFDDPTIGLRFPLAVGATPIVSAKDREAATLLERRPGTAAGTALKRVLVVGASGQVGTALTAVFGSETGPAGQHVVIGTYRGVQTDPLQVQFDLEDAAGADGADRCHELMLAAGLPDVVCIAAAFCWVDGCETQRDKADAVNAVGPGNVAAAAAAIGAKVVYYSSDYVFDGVDGPYDETAQTSPLNYYGASKLAGELQVQAAAPDAIVIRTTGVYGPDAQGKNFILQLIRKLGDGETMTVPADQVTTPTYTADLAEATARLVAKSVSGVYNVAGPQLMDRFTFALEACRVLGLDQSKVSRAVTKDLGQVAARPLRAGLSNRKVTAALPGYRPTSVEASLRQWAPPTHAGTTAPKSKL